MERTGVDGDGDGEIKIERGMGVENERRER